LRANLIIVGLAGEDISYLVLDERQRLSLFKVFEVEEEKNWNFSLPQLQKLRETRANSRHVIVIDTSYVHALYKLDKMKAKGRKLVRA
jgi:hypothetical protein